jgi:hypothetical protein
LTWKSLHLGAIVIKASGRAVRRAACTDHVVVRAARDRPTLPVAEQTSGVIAVILNVTDLWGTFFCGLLVDPGMPMVVIPMRSGHCPVMKALWPERQLGWPSRLAVSAGRNDWQKDSVLGNPIAVRLVAHHGAG